MDTSNHPPFFISPDVLAARRGRADAPLLLDVRCEAKFLASPLMLAGALGCKLENLAAFAETMIASAE